MFEWATLAVAATLVVIALVSNRNTRKARRPLGHEMFSRLTVATEASCGDVRTLNFDIIDEQGNVCARLSGVDGRLIIWLPKKALVRHFGVDPVEAPGIIDGYHQVVWELQDNPPPRDPNTPHPFGPDGEEFVERELAKMRQRRARESVGGGGSS